MDNLTIVFWYWWVLALLLLVIEMLVPGFFFLWMSAAALITGLVVGLLPGIGMASQVLIFSVLAIAAITAWGRFGRHITIKSDRPLLNKRGQQYIGRVFNLHEAIENGQGRIKVDDTLWKVHGDDCPVGSKVQVTAVNGTVFEVIRTE